MITIIEHRRETSLLLASQIPATFDGRLRVNIANAMAAAAAALAEDVQLEYIRQALRTFTSSFFQTPGRFNLLEVQGRRVIMDYCHNVAGLESMADFVKRMEPERTHRHDLHARRPLQRRYRRLWQACRPDVRRTRHPRRHEHPRP